MTNHDRIAAAIRANPMGVEVPHAPPVIYDLPMNPLTALRGGDRWTKALVVTASLAVVLSLCFLFAGA